MVNIFFSSPSFRFSRYGPMYPAKVFTRLAETNFDPDEKTRE